MKFAIPAGVGWFLSCTLFGMQFIGCSTSDEPSKERNLSRVKSQSESSTSDGSRSSADEPASLPIDMTKALSTMVEYDSWSAVALKGIDKVAVVLDAIDSADDSRKSLARLFAISDDQFKSVITAKLTQAGIRVVPVEDSTNKLYFAFTILRAGNLDVVVVSGELQLRQVVRMANDPTVGIFATTWAYPRFTGSAGFADRDVAKDGWIDALGNAVDHFVGHWQMANK